MIPLTITQALAVYSSALGLLIAAIWLYTEVSVWRPARILQRQRVWRCVFCGFTYLDEVGVALSECPRCHSINSVEDKHAKLVRVRIPDELLADSRTHSDELRRNPSRQKRKHQRRRGPRRRSR